MKARLAILFTSLALTACSEQVEQQTQTTEAVPAKVTNLDTYKQQAQSLLGEIRANGASQKLEQSSQQLVATSRQLLAEFTAKYPACDSYLTALDKAADIIPTLPLEEIESGYHKDGKLPKYDSPVCYHAKDLLVHPATVQAMAAQGMQFESAYEDAELEIVEVIAHFDQVEKALR